MSKYMACICGWVSEAYPDDYMFMGFGGTLDCPLCRAELRNPTLEMCYGHVDVITSEELAELREQESRGIMWEQAWRNLTRKKLGLDKPVLLTTPFYTTGETNKHIDLEKTEDKIRKLKRKSIRNQGKYKSRGKEKRREP
jgi:hypothetical protein